MNKVILTGNLCRDIELKQTPNGKEVLLNCVAVQRNFKAENGEYESDFINIVVWGAAANYLANYASKGDRVELVGRWQVRKYEDSNGTQQIVNECVVESIKVFSRQPKADEQEESRPPMEEIDDNKLPF